MNIYRKVLRRRTHYRAAFQNPSGELVLADLKRFSGYGTSPAVVSLVRQQVDPIATAMRIGRQEMFMRIIGHLHLDDAQLIRLKEEAENE